MRISSIDIRFLDKSVFIRQQSGTVAELFVDVTDSHIRVTEKDKQGYVKHTIHPMVGIEVAEYIPLTMH